MNASESGSRDLLQDFTDIPVWLRAVHGSVLVLLLVTSVVGNSIILLMVLLHKKLQHRSFLASLGLVVADLVIAVVWATQGIASTAAGQLPFGEVGCSVLGAMLVMATSARWCTVATITLDRFCTILFPFWYVGWSKVLLITLTTISWLSPLAIAIPGLSGFGTYEFRVQHSTCVIDCSSDIICFIFYLTFYGIFMCIGSLFPVVLYLMLCIIGTRKAYKINHITLGTFDNSGATNIDTEITNAENAPALAARSDVSGRKASIYSASSSSSSSYCSTTYKSDTSPKSSRTGGSEVKALKTFFMIFVNVFSTQLPIYITSALRSKPELYNNIPIMVHLVIVHIYLLGAILDPLLIMKNTEVREVLKDSLKKRAARNMNKTSIAFLLLDMARISSLHEVKVTGNNSHCTRRHSCPDIQQHRAMELKIHTIPQSNSCIECTSLDIDVVLDMKGLPQRCEVMTVTQDQGKMKVCGKDVTFAK